jgi:tRNA A-37 threonylcarbamoyl transferase component Bud32
VTASSGNFIKMEQIGPKYEVLAELGRGGFGTVFKARHAGLNKIVAVKVLHTALLRDPTIRARFELEAKAGANLSHPNLVSVFDYGFTEQDEPYLVMEYVEGKSLYDFLYSSTPTTDDLLNILIQTGKALRYLHDSNIVHRDLKTSNILVQDIGGERYARLLDLGIAKVFTPESGGEKSAHLTSTGMVFGSPSFMSPEQCQGYAVDGRSDIYSFGCVIYECMSKELPFSGENSVQVILKHLHETPKALSYKTQREFELTQVVAKCMAKEPADRYQSMKELLAALQKITTVPQNEKAQARPDNLIRSYTPPPTAPAADSKPMGAIVAAVALILLAACVIPLGVMLYGQMSKKVATPIVAPPPAVVQQAPPMVQPSPPVIAQPAPVAQPAPNQAAEEKAAAALALMKAQEDKAALEKETAKQKADLEQAKADLAAAKDESVRTSVYSPEMQAMYRKKAEELAKATTARSEENMQAMRAFDQSTQSMQNGADAMRKYNDEMAQRNGLKR